MSLKGTEMTNEEYLKIRASLLEKEIAEQGKQQRKYVLQRNIALVLCAVFFAIALLFATRPASAAPAAKAAAEARLPRAPRLPPPAQKNRLSRSEAILSSG